MVKDGRVLIGEFLCIDKQANLILGNTYQQVQGYATASTTDILTSEIEYYSHMRTPVQLFVTCRALLPNNLLLALCSEKERPIGQVLVPALQRKSCHVEVLLAELRCTTVEHYTIFACLY